jgi:hypothetical protein
MRKYVLFLWLKCFKIQTGMPILGKSGKYFLLDQADFLPFIPSAASVLLEGTARRLPMY